eukprot:2871824-Pleurochrysis_carterae.AAC.1
MKGLEPSLRCSWTARLMISQGRRSRPTTKRAFSCIEDRALVRTDLREGPARLPLLERLLHEGELLRGRAEAEVGREPKARREAEASAHAHSLNAGR